MCFYRTADLFQQAGILELSSLLQKVVWASLQAIVSATTQVDVKDDFYSKGLRTLESRLHNVPLNKGRALCVFVLWGASGVSIAVTLARRVRHKWWERHLLGSVGFLPNSALQSRPRSEPAALPLQ